MPFGQRGGFCSGLYESGSLLELHSVGEVDLDVAGGGVAGELRTEADLGAHDVVGGGELVLALGTGRGDINLEGAEVVDLDAVAVLQLVLHHLCQLDEHGVHVRLLDGTVALDALCQLLAVDGGGVDGASVELARSDVLSIVLVGYVLNYSSHSKFSFLTPSRPPQRGGVVTR